MSPHEQLHELADHMDELHRLAQRQAEWQRIQQSDEFKAAMERFSQYGAMIVKSGRWQPWNDNIAANLAKQGEQV